MNTSVEFLLAPVSPTSPSGKDIRYSPSFDLVRTLYRQAQTESTAAGWRLAAEQLESLLRTQSKDLFLAAWLMEAWTRLDGFAGASAGLDLITGMIESFWDSMYPSLDEEGGSAEPRVGVLEWLEGPFVSVLADAPITRSPAAAYNVLQLAAHRRFGGHGAGLGPSAKDVQEALSLTGSSALEGVVSAVDGAGRSLTRLASVVARRFGSEGATAFLRVREVLETAREFATAGISRLPEQSAGPPPATEPPVGATGEVRPAISMPAASDSVEAVRGRAESLYAAGHVADAIQEWQVATDVARSGRERFMLRLALGEFCLEAGLADVARHLLDGVCTDLELRHLDEWENRQTISRAWAALYQACVAAGTNDAAARAAYAYARLCDVDTAQAVALRAAHPPVFESKSQ